MKVKMWKLSDAMLTQLCHPGCPLFKRLLVFITVFLLFFSTATCYSITGKQIIKVGTGDVSFDTMIRDISSARIIFIGEDHTNVNHHRNQSYVIRALHEKGIPLSIGLEMFRKKEQENLDKWISGKMKNKDFISLFYENWGYGWGLYKDIFLFARAKKIPLVGLNVPKAITRKVGQGPRWT